MKYNTTLLEAREAGMIDLANKPKTATVEICNDNGPQYRIISEWADMPPEAWKKWKSTKELSCNRCGHTWMGILPGGQKPLRCPKCHSLSWQRPHPRNAIYSALRKCRCGHSWPIEAGETMTGAKPCPQCGDKGPHDQETVLTGYSPVVRDRIITPMIWEEVGKWYRSEWVCHPCGISWPKDSNSRNVSCPKCRRKCGATDRQVEISRQTVEAADGK